MNKPLLFTLFFLLLSLAFAQAVPTGTKIEPSSALIQIRDIILSLTVPLMMLMAVAAAVVYTIGSMFGADTRARASVWAQSMLAAVAVSAALIMLLLFFLPGYSTGHSPLKPAVGTELTNTVKTLLKNSEAILFDLIIVLLVIGALVYMIGQMFDSDSRARAVVWSTGMLVGAVFASVLYVFAYIILPKLLFNTDLDVLNPFKTLLTFIMMLIFVIILITYTVARVLRVPEWEAYLSIELSNLVNSVLIIFFILAFFEAGKAVSLTFTGFNSVPQAAMTFLNKDIAPDVLDGVFDVMQLQMCSSILSTFARRIGEFVLTNTYKVFPGIDTFVSITNVLTYGLVAIYGSISAQITFMSLIDATMYTFFLPAGLILRFFQPTRDSGSFLIALALGFQMIFPTCYLINKFVLEDPQLGFEKYSTPSTLLWMVCGPPAPGHYVLSGYFLGPGFLQHFGLGNTLGLVLKTIFSEGLLNLLPMTEVVVILKVLSTLTLTAIFLPALSMIITIAFINAITKFLMTKV